MKNTYPYTNDTSKYVIRTLIYPYTRTCQSRPVIYYAWDGEDKDSELAEKYKL